MEIHDIKYELSEIHAKAKYYQDKYPSSTTVELYGIYELIIRLTKTINNLIIAMPTMSSVETKTE